MMDEVEGEVPEEAGDNGYMTVGERLREAREKLGLSVEDIATQTRIPTRHLESLERSEFDKLPAPTYTLGFAKGYAAAVGLDRQEIGDALREELGTTRPANTMPDELPEPADPSRAMPMWLIAAALAAVVLVVVLFSWLKNRDLDPGEEPPAAVASAEPGTETAAPTPTTASGPVVLVATDRVWLQVYEEAGGVLFQGELGPGQRYEVPADAAAPLLRTGRPEAIRVMVGSATAPAVGPEGQSVSGVSLLASDLMAQGSAAPAEASPAAPEPVAAAPARTSQASTPRSTPARTTPRRTEQSSPAPARTTASPTPARTASPTPAASQPAASTAAPAQAPSETGGGESAAETTPDE